MELILGVAHNDGVAGIVAAAIANHHLGLSRKVVHHLALGLVAPLSAHNHDICHYSRSPAPQESRPRGAVRSSLFPPPGNVRGDSEAIAVSPQTNMDSARAIHTGAWLTTFKIINRQRPFVKSDFRGIPGVFGRPAEAA